MDERRFIPLTLTSHYASSWGVWEGIRELVQNWHDGLYTMIDSLDVVSSTPLQLHFEKKSAKGLEEEFEAYVINPENGKKIVLGVLIFDRVNDRLTLINKCTCLHKKILLMGYTEKTAKREVIGQFGEGLKVGALSLVRDGRSVTMETSTDRWRFDIVHNVEFGEKVLTVIVSGRQLTEKGDGDPEFSDDTFPTCPRKLEASDICTTVTNVSSEEWKTFLPRFLFLTPPQESVKTELGALLLDDLLAGQLYVKGVWVSDLSGEDLAAGVDFDSLQLDRDRNAVPRPSEIDHLVSGIWIKAVTLKPRLISKYYELLLQEKYRDVRHAAQYVSDTALPAMISSQFILQNGEDAIPVINTVSMEKLQDIRRELSTQVVLCNQTLLNILNQSGRHISVDQALVNLLSRRQTQIPYSQLTQEQQNVLRHAGKLIKLADKNFDLSLFDVVHSALYETCTSSGSRVVIPDWMLDLKIVHDGRRLCPSSSNQCQCREAWICCAVLELRKEMISRLKVDVPKANLLALASQYNRISPLQVVVALLAMENCDQTRKGFCSDLHTRAYTSDGNHADNILIAELKDREKGYIRKISSLEQTLVESVEESRIKLSKLQQKLEAAEKGMMTHEATLVNVEENIKSHCEAKLQQAKLLNEANCDHYQKKIKSLDDVVMNLKRDLKFKDDQLNAVKKQYEGDADVFRRKQENSEDELHHYIEKYKNSLSRTEQLAKQCEERCDKDDRVAKEKFVKLAEICDIVLQDLQKEKFLCALCKVRRKDSMFQPCGHYASCNDCAAKELSRSGQCPLCKTMASGCQIVYE